jgi:tRNA(Arg) A34 adenosine deaminase TadA
MGNDKTFLAEAVKIAISGIKKGGGPFGAVIVKDNKVIAGSNNKVVLSGDPTAHAEILVIREAARLLKTYDLNQCVLYSTCEPCPMCLGAVYWSGIKRVVYAATRHDADTAGFSDNLIYNEIALDPSSRRKVIFQHRDDPAAIEIFKLWEKCDDKIMY